MSQEDVIVLSSDDQSEEGEIIDESSINEHTSVQAKLMRALNLNPGQVPEYIMRMRNMGPAGYPPALIDEHVRVSDSLPFFGETVDKILPRRTVSKETLPAFRGFTHLDGSYPSDSFVRLMRQVAEIDRDKSQQDAMDRSGIESFKSNEDRTQESVVIRRKSEVIRYEIPEHEAVESSDYLFATKTKSMRHSLDGFAAGIQPFQNTTISTPTFFMKKLKGILDKTSSSITKLEGTGGESGPSKSK